MEISISLIACWALAAFALWAFLDWVRDRNKPTVYNYPVFGDLLVLLRKISTIHDQTYEDMYLVSKAQNREGPTKTTFFKRPIMGLRGWNTVDKRCVEHILKTNYANYVIAPLRQHIMGDFIGHGIFGADGDLWKLQRKTASYEFSNNNFRNFMFEEFKSHSDMVKRCLKQAVEKGETLDMQDLFARFTLASICKIAFGVEVWDPFNEFSGDKEVQQINLDCELFAHQWNSSTQRCIQRLLDPATTLLKALNLGKEATMAKNLAGINELLEKVMDIRLKLSESDLSSKCDLLSRYLQLGDTCDTPGYPHKDFVKDMVTSFIIAGRDTTASLLSWTMAILTFNRDVEAKMLQEIQDKLPGAKEGEIDYDVIRSELHYVQATMYEVLRLYPAVPYDIKTAAADDVWPDGTVIKAGDQCAYVPYSQGRLEEYWPEPLKFRPERFLDDEGRFVRPDPYTFSAFQAGPRVCLGMEMALLEVKTLLVTFMPHFSMRFPEGHDGKMPAYGWDLTLPVLGELRMVPTRR